MRTIFVIALLGVLLVSTVGAMNAMAAVMEDIAYTLRHVEIRKVKAAKAFQ